MLKNLAAVIAGAFDRVLIAVMPYAGTALNHNHPRSLTEGTVDVLASLASPFLARLSVMRKWMPHRTGDLPYFRNKTSGHFATYASVLK